MASRALDRIAATVSVVLLAALGLFTFYLAQVADRSGAVRVARPPSPDRFDYFVDRLALLTMNAAGEPSFRLEATRLRHYEATGNTEFEDPVMVSLDPARPRITITADHGRLLNGSEEAHLSGGVVVTRAATAGAAPLRATTDFAIVLPDRDIVRTDRPVEIVQGGHLLTGVGMELDNRTRRLRVDSDVRAVLAPPVPASGPPPGAARPAR